jgi:1-acyl-sn-glycerol-3-phosphate acyltransferase
VLVLLFSLGLLTHTLLRLVERPLLGLRRPVSARLVQSVCAIALRILGLPLRRDGMPMPGQGAMVCNHVSWLDILVLNAARPVYFVSKAEVAAWPGIGLLARVTGTVFIERDRRAARMQKLLFEARLRAGHRLMFFPEGTSTDGQQVLPFKSTLFEAFFAPELRDFLHIQPVSLIYHAPNGQDPRFYGWWGDMALGPHLLRVLAQPRQGRVELVFHPALRLSESPGRKALAQQCEGLVRQGLERHRA